MMLNEFQGRKVKKIMQISVFFKLNLNINLIENSLFLIDLNSDEISQFKLNVIAFLIE